MTEEWRVWRDGAYEVSSLGRIRRAKPGRRTIVGQLLSPIKMRVGYLCVRPVICGKNVQTYVHAMVAECFLGQRPIGAEVNHIDGNKQNNSVENLEYVTHASNMAHASRSGLLPRGEGHRCCKLSAADVAAIREKAAQGSTLGTLVAEYRVSKSLLSTIINRKARV